MNETATEQLLSSRDDNREALLDRRMTAFVEDYAPTNRRANAEFSARLVEIVRDCHALGARPYQATMDALLRAVPWMPPVWPRPEKDQPK